MRLDRSFIAIRRRTVLETLDLALHVVRRYPGALLVYLVWGALPWGLLNCWLSYAFTFELGQNAWLNLLLVAAEAQLGTLFVTSFLGQALFVGQPSWQVIVRDVLRALPGMIWLQGCLRLLFPILLLVFLARNSSDRDTVATCLVLAGLGLAMSGLVRMMRPFASEILILEKTPFRVTADQLISFGKRSSAMHRYNVGESLSLLLLMLMFSGPLVVSLFGTFSLSFELLGVSREVAWFHSGLLWQISLWLVAGFWSVVRFLNYIETRIRQEGWEVELRIRAAAIQLAERLAADRPLWGRRV